MNVVYKYKLETIGNQLIEMPIESKILTVQKQYGVIVMWCMVDTRKEIKERIIRIIGTGFDPTGYGEYINTVQLGEGNLVLHVFDDGYKVNTLENNN